MPKDSFNKIFGNKKRVLVVMAHPDDNEIICGGTVARLIDEGKKVRLVVMTNGGKGFQNRTDITEEEFAKLRIEEQIKAGLELGIPESENFNLNIPDGELEAGLENIEKIVFHIRQFKPDLIITQNPEEVINTFSQEIRWINHRDHRHVALIAVDASYPYCRDRGFFPHHFSEHNFEPHYVSEFLFSDSYTHPEVLYFDVTKYVGQKKKALQQYQSSLSEKEAEGLIEEIKTDEGSFELFRYVKTD